MTNEEYLNALEANEGIIHKIASSWRLQTYGLEDLKQEIALSFYQYKDDFDPSRGKLSTFITQVANSKCNALKRYENRDRRTENNDYTMSGSLWTSNPEEIVSLNNRNSFFHAKANNQDDLVLNYIVGYIKSNKTNCIKYNQLRTLLEDDGENVTTIMRTLRSLESRGSITLSGRVTPKGQKNDFYIVPTIKTNNAESKWESLKPGPSK